MTIKNNYFKVLMSVLIIMTISGCSGNGSKSKTNNNTQEDSSADIHAQIQDSQMVRIDAFKKGMQ